MACHTKWGLAGPGCAFHVLFPIDTTCSRPGGKNSSAMDPGRKTKLKLPITASSEHTAQRKADIDICETLGLWCFVPAAQPGWRKGGQTAEHRVGL